MARDSVSDSAPLLGSSGTKSTSGHLKVVSLQSSGNGFCHSLSLVTVEPAMFLISMSYGIELIFKTNMLVDKTCSVQLGYSSDVCRDLDSGRYKAQQDSVQRLTANYSLYCQMIELLPGALVTMLLGTWSDTRGRRLPLLFPLAGSTLKSLGLYCNAYWWSLQPFFVPLSFIPYGLSGGFMAVFMAAYAYVSDYSSHRGRTTRLAITGMILYVAMPIGNVLGGALFSHGSYTSVFGLNFIVNFLALVYIAIRVKNIKPKAASRTTVDGRKVTVFSQLRESLSAVARRRVAGGRACILGHTCCIALYMITFGSSNLAFLYTREKFQWDYVKFTTWTVWNSVASVIASIVLVPLLSLRFHMDDTILAFSGAASHLFNGILVGTATRPWILYAAVVLSAGGGITISCSRGALSKLVKPDELGAVFSVVGLFESMAPVLTSPIYTLVYNNTLDVFPGTVFLISAGVTLIICCIYTWLATAFPTPPSNGKVEERS